MSAHSTNQLDSLSTSVKGKQGKRQLEVMVTSFGYKQGPPPLANVVFDVRFLKNPYWVEELRPLTGLDEPVQRYVLDQPAAREFLDMLSELLGKILPKMAELNVERYVIALGCTGGQHRSATLVQALAQNLTERFPEYKVIILHRELSKKSDAEPCCESTEPDEEQ